MKTDNVISIVVTVGDDWMNKFNIIKDKLLSVGMQIEKVMPKLGVISGTVSNPSKIRSVEGVESVDIESSHSLPPSNVRLQ